MSAWRHRAATAFDNEERSAIGSRCMVVSNHQNCLSFRHFLRQSA